MAPEERIVTRRRKPHLPTAPQSPVRRGWEAWLCLLNRSVDGASLAAFRICFGLVLVGLAVQYLWPRANGTLVEQFYVRPKWHFAYPGFEWLRPWPAPWMSVELVLLGAAGLFTALGLYTRPATVALALVFGHLFLLDETLYHNHYYLILLLAGSLALMPAATCFSLDRWRKSCRSADGRDYTDAVPFWPVLVLRWQMFLLYFYAGIHKLHPDWLSGRAMWLAGARLHEFLERGLGSDRVAAAGEWATAQTLAQGIALAGLVYDVSIGLLLLGRRTRFLGLVLTVLFHGSNWLSFDLGFLPILAIASTLIFFEPDWPRRVGRWIRHPTWRRPDWPWAATGAVLVPAAGLVLGWKSKAAPAVGGKALSLRPWAAAALALWLAFQSLWPARHWLIDGDAQWTEEGQRFSWRMMLRRKRGQLTLHIDDPGMFRGASEGPPTVDWRQWQRHFDKAVYLDVDPPAIDWADSPELVVLFEPHVGERVLYNPAGAGLRSLDAARTRLVELWRAEYGREPQVVPTVSFEESLAHIERALGTARVRQGELVAAGRKALETPDATTDGARLVPLWDRLDELLRDPESGPRVRRELARTHPFALAGRVHEGLPFLSVTDPTCERLDARNRGRIDRGAWRGPSVVYLDVTRIRHDGWLSLPAALLLYQGERLTIEWNFHVDLEPRQIRHMQGMPFLIHGYAGRVAGRWQDLFGRRPRVYAAQSATELNFHAPRPLIDPAVDLARTPRRLLTHNSWIMPYDPPTDEPIHP
jgi:hypothetical protein